MLDAWRRWRPTGIAAVTLVFLAIVSAALWRVENEQHAWHGTDWVYRTHLAFPVALAAFVAWSIAVARILHGTRGVRLAILVVLLSAIAVFGYFATQAVLLFAFGGWAGGLLSMEVASSPQTLAEVPGFLGKPQAVEVLLRDLIFWSVWLLPTVVLWGTLRAAGIRSPIWSVPASAMLQFWAWPISIWLYALTSTGNATGPDHALESGYVIPWLVIAVGIPLLATPSRRAAESGSELVG